MTIYESARKKLIENKFSIESWNILIKDALDKPIDKAREFFEELVGNFPTCGRFWKIYIEEELKAKNYRNVEKLFTRSLTNVLQIDLWKCYITYIKESRANEENFSELVKSAYEMALEKIGIDVMSYSIWIDYINLLKSLKCDKYAIRSIYLKALRNPMMNIEQLWKDYSQFENKSVSEELTKEFQSIKKVSREYEGVTRPLERHLPSLPLNQVTSFEEEIKQLQAWKRYIIWEKQNPLKLVSQQELTRRVMFAYEQAFMCMAYHCDVWYEAANFLYQQTKLSDESVEPELKRNARREASHLYERAINSFMKNNGLIYLSYADFEERLGNFQKTYEIYEKCIQNPHIEEPTLIWIHYIRFARRHEDLAAARKLFRRAREDSRSTFPLFIANADIEYFAGKDKTVGFKIFQLGAKKYSTEPEYILSFLKYMAHLNEDNNTRVLFERVLSSDDLPSQNTNEIWSEFLKFECGVGDLASILKVDKKRQKFYESTQNTNDWSETILLIDRYKYMDLLPCSQNELKSIGYKDIPAKQSSQSNTLLTNMNLTQAEYAAVAANEIKRAKFPVPDITQMLPFKPVRNATGGVFPFPPAITELVKRLPPPNTFDGPFVKIDELIKQIAAADLRTDGVMSEDFQMNYVYLNGEPIKELEHLANIEKTLVPGQIGFKRSAVGNGNNSDDEDSKGKSKTMDIYKQRQVKKLMQHN